MTFTYKDTVLLKNSELEQEGKRLVPYIKHIQSVIQKGGYEEPEASLNLPSDSASSSAFKTLAQQVASKQLRMIFIIGIGGSNLGTKALYDALAGHFSPIGTGSLPQVIFLDTINSSYVSQLKAYLSEHTVPPEQYVINVVTKSGTTAETIINLEVLLTLLPNSLKRTVVTTDQGSKLDQLAAKKNLYVLHIPKQVGGRFSVFSPVGILPLSLIGMDVDQLLAGARNARDHNITDDILNNPAAISALLLFLYNKKGYVINDNFFFNAEMESVGKWYRQLMGESVGKEGKGITPTVSIGSTDLHSMVQLYLGGPNNKYTTFYWANRDASRHNDEPVVPDPVAFEGLVSDIPGKKPSQVLHMILKGTQAAYTKNRRPYSEIIMDDISEFSLGELMQFKMLEMMYLGNLLGVNTFDQPNVEDYKEVTRTLMSSTHDYHSPRR